MVGVTRNVPGPVLPAGPGTLRLLVVVAMVAAMTLLGVTGGQANALAGAMPPTTPVLPPSVLPGAGTVVETTTGAVTLGEVEAVGVAASSGPVEVAAAGFAIGWYGVKAVSWAYHNWFQGSPVSGAAAAFWKVGTATWNATSGVWAIQLFHIGDDSSFASAGAWQAGVTYADGSYCLDESNLPFSSTTFAATVTVSGGPPTNCRAETNPPVSTRIHFQNGSVEERTSSLAVIAVSPYRHMEQTLTCRLGDGSTQTVVSDGADFDATASTVSSPGALVMPAMVCPDGSHVECVSEAILGGPVPEAGPSYCLPAPARDPNNADATCLAKAGSTPCGLYTQPDGCHWGAYVLVSADCADTATSASPPPVATQTAAPPTTGTGSGTTTVTGPAPPDDPSGGGCFPSGWGVLNPVEWVLKPVKCALTWAFVPDQAHLDNITSMRDGLMQRAPAVYIADAGTFVGQVLGGGTPGGCFTISVNLASLGSYPILTCDDIITQQLIRLRPLMLVAVYVSFFGPMAWWAWRQYAPGSQANG